jgi:hypothetical protein
MSDGQWVGLIILAAMAAAVAFQRLDAYAGRVIEDHVEQALNPPELDDTPLATEAMAVVLRRREIAAELSAADERRGS